MCELVINLKLSAAEPALRQAYTNKCENIRRPVCGALAAFGDQEALRRASSIHSCGRRSRSSCFHQDAILGRRYSVDAGPARGTERQRTLGPRGGQGGNRTPGTEGDRNPATKPAGREVAPQKCGTPRWVLVNKIGSAEGGTP